MNVNSSAIEGSICPLPLAHQTCIVLGHGSGGKMSQDLISRVFLPPFDNPSLQAGDDAGVVDIPGYFGTGQVPGKLAISTDSHVVYPLVFPGGDIGKLAVCGTVNDVSMMGAIPLYLTAGFILEEGLEIALLEQVVASMQTAALEAGVQIIAGDTKVVQNGKADGMYINTTGVGVIPPGIEISGALAQPGDVIILSGSIGEHGIAVLQARGDLGFSSDISSDVAPLNHLVQAVLAVSKHVHVLRDPTRGGLAATLNEIACQSKTCLLLDEASIPIKPVVASACEMLGFDPLYIANEGKLILIASREDANQIIDRMRKTQYGEEAVVIGKVLDDPKGRVLMKTIIGSTRVVDIPSGEILPRIC